jgi:hypothetical protein
MLAMVPTLYHQDNRGPKGLIAVLLLAILTGSGFETGVLAVDLHKQQITSAIEGAEKLAARVHACSSDSYSRKLELPVAPNEFEQKEH